MTQPTLFDRGQVVPNTLCTYIPRCKGVRHELRGPGPDDGECVNTPIYCCKCNARVGTQSERTDR